jgi:hypothetical protein
VTDRQHEFFFVLLHIDRINNDKSKQYWFHTEETTHVLSPVIDSAINHPHEQAIEHQKTASTDQDVYEIQMSQKDAITATRMMFEH